VISVNLDKPKITISYCPSFDEKIKASRVKSGIYLIFIKQSPFVIQFKAGQETEPTHYKEKIWMNWVNKNREVYGGQTKI
jgi:hypothetical protein